MDEIGLERWQGRVAVVTGASSGIGRAVTLDLVRGGMRVAACARRLERIRALAGELTPDEAARLLALGVDLRNPTEIVDLFGAVRAQWGGVDVLVNNAGLGYQSSLLEGDVEKWREMLEVNVLALCLCTREAVRDMRERGVDGQVVNISSMSGHRVTGGGGVYAATKHAVRALTEGLRQELRAAGCGIRVTAVSPGFVETGFAAVYLESEEKAREQYAGMEALGPEDISRTILFALSQPPHVQLHDVLVRPTRQSS